MRIIFLSAWHPYPPDNGSKLRIYNLLRGLSQQHYITLVTFADEHSVSRSAEPDQHNLTIRVVPRREYNPGSARALLGFFSPTPRHLVDTYMPLMAQRIREELEDGHYDLVIASQWDTVAYWQTWRSLPALFEEIELGILEAKKEQARTRWQKIRHELPTLKLRLYLQRLLPHFRACTVVSQAEGDLVRRTVPGYKAVEVIPNGVRLADYRDVRETPQPNTLIFTGSFRYFANHDAMQWFLQQVYPRIQARLPETRLTITGDHAHLPLPPADNVTLTGFVDDVRPSIAASWVSLAPIWLGGGTRLKILEAMALRTPVIATSKGAEGLDVQSGEHLLIADTPETFAEAAIRLLQDAALRRRLTENAYQLVSEKYDWAVIMPRFLSLVERVAHT